MDMFMQTYIHTYITLHCITLHYGTYRTKSNLNKARCVFNLSWGLGSLYVV